MASTARCAKVTAGRVNQADVLAANGVSTGNEANFDKEDRSSHSSGGRARGHNALFDRVVAVAGLCSSAAANYAPAHLTLSGATSQQMSEYVSIRTLPTADRISAGSSHYPVLFAQVLFACKTILRARLKSYSFLLCGDFHGEQGPVAGRLPLVQILCPTTFSASVLLLLVRAATPPRQPCPNPHPTCLPARALLSQHAHTTHAWLPIELHVRLRGSLAICCLFRPHRCCGHAKPARGCSWRSPSRSTACSRLGIIRAAGRLVGAH